MSLCATIDRSLTRAGQSSLAGSVGGPRVAKVVALFVVLVPFCAAAQTASKTGASFFARYQSRVSATQSQQPHWVTPLVTVTPRLEQEFRTDFVRQSVASSCRIWNYGNSKGLELIPERHTEVIFNLPPFFSRESPHSRDGFGDVSFLLKERIFARNEEHGNAIVTAFLGASIPTGKNGNGSCCAVVTPTLAIGKGFGLLALTMTAGGSLPVSNAKGLGHTIAWNSAVQYRLAPGGVLRFLWPEVEINSNFYRGGANDGKETVFVTPGLVVGRIPLTHDENGGPGRLGVTLGVGEQIALTRIYTTNHNLIFTARLPF
jgi:hypothetical protein